MRVKKRYYLTSKAYRPPEYWVWKAMKDRCLRSTHKSFPNYGGRGISVCKTWLESFPQFLADMGQRPSPEHSIEREDNDGNYEPGNCVWALQSKQINNRRTTVRLTFRGETKSVSEWALELGFSLRLLQCRLQRGWSIDRTLTESVGSR